MIYTAVLIACLASAPTDCRTHEIIIYGNGIPYGPAMEAQIRAAEWLAQHPELEKRSLTVHVGRRA